MNSALPQKVQKILEQVIQMTLPAAVKMAGPVLVTMKRADGEAPPDKRPAFIDEFKQGMAGLFQQILEKPKAREAASSKKSAGNQDDMEERISKYSLMDTDALEAQLVAERLCASLEQEYRFPIDCAAMRIEKFCGLTFEQSSNPLLAKHITMVFRKACDELQPTKYSSDVAMENWGKMLKENYPQWLEQLNGTMIKLHVLPRLTMDDVKDRYQKQDQEKAREMRKNLIADITGKSQDDDTEVSDEELMQSLKALVANAAKDSPTLIKHLVSGSANGPAVSKDEVLETLRQITSAAAVNEETGYKYLTGDEKTLAEKILTSTDIQSKALDDQTQNAISLLSMMFDKLQQEEQIAEPIKPLINELQIPILKLAVKNQDFFSNPDNPAQELLNEIAKAGAHWTPKQNISKDPFYKKISSIVEEITTAIDSNEEQDFIFDEKLHTFKEFIEKEERRASILEDRIIQAESVSARTQAARTMAEKTINRKIFRHNAQKSTTEFLQEHWVKVLFFYINKDDEYSSPEQTQATELIDALLVVRPENITACVDEIFAQLSEMLGNLSLDVPDIEHVFGNIRGEIEALKQQARAELEAREAALAEAAALEAAEKAAAEAEAARLHAAAEKAAAEELAAQQEAARLKVAAEKAAAEQAAALAAAAREQAAAEKAAAEAEVARLRQAAERAAAEELAAQQEAMRLKAAAEQAAAEEEVAKKIAAEQATAKAQAAAEQAAAEQAARDAQELADSLAEMASIEDGSTDDTEEDGFDKRADTLRAESWFRLNNPDFDNAKIKLAAIIKHNGNYIFVNREGVKVITTQKTGVASMMRCGELTIVDDAVFFDRALESVIHSLRR